MMVVGGQNLRHIVNITTKQNKKKSQINVLKGIDRRSKVSCLILIFQHEKKNCFQQNRDSNEKKFIGNFQNAMYINHDHLHDYDEYENISSK